MEFNQFVDEVKGRIKQFLPIEYEDAQVRIEEVKKLNENYLGITVLKENQVIAPTFNLNQLYKMYQSDPEVSMGSILRSITELVLDVPEQFNPKSITEYENAKKKLFIRVSSAEKNEEMLQNVPHQMREDLAITYHLAIRIDDIGVGSTTITNDILDSYGKMIMEECQNGFDEKTKQKLHELMKAPEQREQKHQKNRDRLEHYQKFFENGTYERSWESGTEGNYNMVDGQVNNLKSAEGKRVERKPVQRPEQSSKKKPKKRESVIKRLREKQIAIAVKSGKPVPRYLEQDMERRRG